MCLLLCALFATEHASAAGAGPTTHLLPTRLPKGYRLVKPDNRQYPSSLRNDALTTRTLFLADGIELPDQTQGSIGSVGAQSCPSRLSGLGEVEESVVFGSSEVVHSIEPYVRQLAFYCASSQGNPARLTIQGTLEKSESFRGLLHEYVSMDGQVPAVRTFTQTLLINFDFGVARYRFGSRTIEFRVQRCKPSRLFDQPTGTLVEFSSGRGVLGINTFTWRPEPDVCATVQAQGLDPKQLYEFAKSARPASTRIWEAATGKWVGEFPPMVSPP